MKRILIAVLFGLTLFISQTNFAAKGLFFNVGPTATPANVNITLCLNAKGPLSCQHYTVAASNIRISTTIPNRTYPFAGIRIDTPGYTIADTGLNCTPLSNGFCMFSVSDKMPVNINLAVDYIVVGVGTAGAVMAKRLSDGNQISVVGLQNGANYDQNPLITQSKNTIITVLSALLGEPLYIDSETIPQLNADGRNLLWVYAVPLGGASSVNAGAWCRATNQVNAQWQAIAGPNWSIANIQNTYVALENYHGLTTNPAARGFNGPLPVRQELIPSQVSVKFTDAIVNALGVSNVLDYNDPNTPIGASAQVQYTQMGINGALRSSSSITFLNSNVMTPNGSGVNGRKLQILFNATAANIIWNGNKAVGVRYSQNGKEFSLNARKGVIVSAGIISSAFLLRSGVGPRLLLNSLNIPVVFDNPNVGQGLADQPRMALIYFTNPNDTNVSESRQLGNIASALADSTVGRELLRSMGTLVNLKNGLFTQIAWLPAPGGNPSVREFRFASINPIPGITVVLFDLVQPKSRGSITITSRDPSVAPTMDLGVLSNPADLELYVKGFQIYIKDINEQLQLIDPTYQMIFPDPEFLEPANEAQLREFIKQNIASDMHFQSHCRMAPLNQGGVVDGTGHVYGTRNLIVADDSIVPVNMDGSPMATAYLVAANIANLTIGK